MNRSWMYGDRTTESYWNGVQEFCTHALQHARDIEDDKICCPCRDCNNMRKFKDINVIEDHLFRRGFKQEYHVWLWHGEKLFYVPTASENVIHEEGNDGESENESCQEFSDDEEDEYEEERINDMIDGVTDNLNDQQQIFETLSKAADTPLYPGCTKYTKLTFTLTLFNEKIKGGWSDSSFTSLLELLSDMFPEGNEVPKSTYYAKKLMCPFGLEYNKIDACPNDCILYRNEYKDFVSCPMCGQPRYKRKGANSMKKGSPAKVLWHAPLGPRFQRLFSIKKQAKLLRWHAEERKFDGLLRHPADSPQWRAINREYVEFGKEARNLRLAICTDGMNPYGSLSSKHSTWPVLVAIYNLPTWLCMKRKYLMLSLLISGPKQPGNDIDVYLRPLVDELKTYWKEGIPVFDAYTNSTFTLRAMVFCTINDFPAYGNLSGYKVKGEQACPICEDDMIPTRLKNYKKNVYMNHRRFLNRFHPYRKQKRQFNGCIEEGEARMPFTGVQVYERIKRVKTIFGKCFTYISQKSELWKKKSIFWELEYWKVLSVRHCLDVMHIEKNVCEALVGTLLNIPGKTKDNVNVRKDMQEFNVRPDLWPKVKEDGSKIYLPPACYTLSKGEKRIFCECLYNIKVPTGYCSNISRIVSLTDLKLDGMKSHDCHVLLCVFLPIAIRGILPNHVRHAVTKLCLFFNTIGNKAFDPEELDKLQADVVETLCRFEMYFPPSFFDIMVHLIIHIIREIKILGPVFLRWMYPFERHMKTLQDKAKNKAKPEGSIIVGTQQEEISEYCSEYMRTQSIGLPVSRHAGRLEGIGTIGRKFISPLAERRDKAHLYVLQNLTIVHPYLDHHLNELKRRKPRLGERALMQEHNRTFVAWFRDKVADELKLPNHQVSNTIKWLSRGPRFLFTSYEGYDINGFTYYTKRQDDKSVVQNSGVMVVASSRVYASAKDKKPVDATQVYYGVIEEIWELDYNDFKVPLFQCKWVENHNGVTRDDYGFTLVDFTRLKDGDEPFILSNQAKQIFYIVDNLDERKRIVVQGKRRILGIDNVEDEEEYDRFDDTPPLSVGVQPLTECEDTHVTNYTRFDHEEGLWFNNYA